MTWLLRLFRKADPKVRAEDRERELLKARLIAVAVAASAPTSALS